MFNIEIWAVMDRTDSYVKVLVPQDVTLSGNRVIAMHTGDAMWGWRQRSGWCSRRQGAQKMAGKSTEAKGGALHTGSLAASGGGNPADTLISDFQPPEL